MQNRAKILLHMLLIIGKPILVAVHVPKKVHSRFGISQYLIDDRFSYIDFVISQHSIERVQS